MCRARWGWVWSWMAPSLFLGATAALSCEMPPQGGAASLESLDAGAFTQRLSHARSAGTPVFTVVALPDTQFYAAKFTELFEAQVTWLLEQHQAGDVAFVLHEGDIVDNDVAEQWAPAAASLHRLDGIVPYVLSAGNHDYPGYGWSASRSTLIDAYFPMSTFTGSSWFGGTFEADHIENNYALFGRPWRRAVARPVVGVRTARRGAGLGERDRPAVRVDASDGRHPRLPVRRRHPVRPHEAHRPVLGPALVSHRQGAWRGERRRGDLAEAHPRQQQHPVRLLRPRHRPGRGTADQRPSRWHDRSPGSGQLPDAPAGEATAICASCSSFPRSAPFTFRRTRHPSTSSRSIPTTTSFSPTERLGLAAGDAVVAGGAGGGREIVAELAVAARRQRPLLREHRADQNRLPRRLAGALPLDRAGSVDRRVASLVRWIDEVERDAERRRGRVAAVDGDGKPTGAFGHRRERAACSTCRPGKLPIWSRANVRRLGGRRRRKALAGHSPTDLRPLPGSPVESREPGSSAE